MLRERELSNFRPQVRIQDGGAVTLGTVQEAVKACAEEHGIPMAFETDQIKFGGMIGGHVEDCLILYHPEHPKDYFVFPVTVSYQSNYAYVSIFCAGESRQMKKQDAAASAKAGAAAVGKSAWKGILNHDDSIGGIFTGAAGVAAGSAKLAKSLVNGIKGLGSNPEKLQMEKNWYDMVGDVIDEIMR